MTSYDDSASEDPQNAPDNSTAPIGPPPQPPEPDNQHPARANDGQQIAPWSTHPAQQHFLQTAGTTNEPFAITMLIVLLVIGLGIAAVLVVLLYRMFAG